MRGRGVHSLALAIYAISGSGFGIESVALHLEIVMTGVTREFASGLEPDET